MKSISAVLEGAESAYFNGCLLEARTLYDSLNEEELLSCLPELQERYHSLGVHLCCDQGDVESANRHLSFLARAKARPQIEILKDRVTFLLSEPETTANNITDAINRISSTTQPELLGYFLANRAALQIISNRNAEADDDLIKAMQQMSACEDNSLFSEIIIAFVRILLGRNELSISKRLLDLLKDEQNIHIPILVSWWSSLETKKFSTEKILKVPETIVELECQYSLCWERLSSGRLEELHHYLELIQASGWPSAHVITAVRISLLRNLSHLLGGSREHELGKDYQVPPYLRKFFDFEIALVMLLRTTLDTEADKVSREVKKFILLMKRKRKSREFPGKYQQIYQKVRILNSMISSVFKSCDKSIAYEFYQELRYASMPVLIRNTFIDAVDDRLYERGNAASLLAIICKQMMRAKERVKPISLNQMRKKLSSLEHT